MSQDYTTIHQWVSGQKESGYKDNQSPMAEKDWIQLNLSSVGFMTRKAWIQSNVLTVGVMTGKV